MKRLVFLLALGTLATACAPRRQVIVTHRDPIRTVHVHDAPRYTPPPTVVHVHDHTCGHVLETHEQAPYETTVVIHDTPPPVRTKFHTHGARCGHVFVDGRWILAGQAYVPPGQAVQHVPPGHARQHVPPGHARQHVPPGHVEVHVHGEGCGHVWAFGRWLTPVGDTQVDKAKKGKSGKDEKRHGRKR